MCIAIYQPAGMQLDDETLKICYRNNPDGCGMAYVHGETGKIEIYKALKFKKWLKRYHRMVTENPESPFLIHFRVKTHGVVSVANCHPFKVDNDHAFIHNGMINKCAPTNRNGDKSDTRLFNEMILQNLPKNWFANEAIKDLIEPWIGNSKLAVLNKDGRVDIINEEKGNWKEGVWFSNTSYEDTFTRKKNLTQPWTSQTRAGQTGHTVVTGGGSSTGGTSTLINYNKTGCGNEAQAELLRFYKSHPDTEFVVWNKSCKKWHPAVFNQERKCNEAWHFGYKAWCKWDYKIDDFDFNDLNLVQMNYIEECRERAAKNNASPAHIAVARHKGKLLKLSDCDQGDVDIEVMCDGCGRSHYYRNLNEFEWAGNMVVDLCISCESRYMASEVQMKKLTNHIPV